MLYRKQLNHYSVVILGMLLLCKTAFFLPADVHADEYDEDYDELELPYVEIKTTTDYFELAEQARDSGKIIMLEISASYCGYCELLEEEIIKPMLRSGDYDDTVLIRKLDIDSYYTIIDFIGDKSTPDEMATAYKIRITPTLLFLDGEGNEAAKRILGVNSLDFFGGYVDEAIDRAIQATR